MTDRDAATITADDAPMAASVDAASAAGGGGLAASRRAADAVPCAHCGLPSPPPRLADELPFCCSGCRGAYDLIRGWGLEDYYALRDRLVASGSSQAVADPTGCDALDDPELLGLSQPRPVGRGLMAVRLAVSGLHCGACAWLIERAARLMPGWHSARVRMNDHTVEIVFDPSTTRLSDIGRLLGRLGYRVAPLVASRSGQRAEAESRRLLTQIAVAAFCAANAMWIAVALYAGEYSGIDPSHASLLRLAGALLGLVAVAGPGATFFRGAWAALRTRTPHMDLPVALGLGVGAVAGMAGAIAAAGDVYFDSIATLVFLLLVGRWVQFRQQRRAAEAVNLLMRLSPAVATRIDAQGQSRRVPVDVLQPGDAIVVAAGEGVPADGTVVAGASLLDRSLMTGESQPVQVGPGDEVQAGTANLQSPLQIRVAAIGPQSRLGRLMQLVEDAAASKSPVVQLADRIGGYFVVTVILLSIVTLVVWSRLAGPLVASQHAVALLIVACPCALALATPLALAVSLGRAARRSILVRGGDVLERLATPGTVWFDKTGTLTEGRLRVVHCDLPDHLLRSVAAVETGSRHPVAQAILAETQRREVTIPAAVDVQQTTGRGVSAWVDDHHVVVGNLEHLLADGVRVTAAVEQQCRSIASDGASPIVVAVDGTAAGVLGVADTLRSDAAAALARLRSTGWQVGILSGDHPLAVASVARRLGIDPDRAMGSLTPEAKLQQIHRSKADGRTVVMVGDGVNDAAALAAADVGVAMRGGAEASLAAAPVFLADGQLAGLPRLVDASARTVRGIRRNFAVSLLYNLVAVALAMAGQINPLVAALLMPISSLSILSLTLAMPTFDRDDSGPCPLATAEPIVAARPAIAGGAA